MSKTEVCCPKSAEATALGAAFLAGLAVGFWEDLNEIKTLNQEENIYYPAMKQEERENLLKGWQRAVKSAKVFSEE